MTSTDKPGFTPGPWWQINGGCHISAKGQQGKIASAHEIYMDKAMRLANAHLIAAAPGLYDVAVMIRDADDDCQRDGLPRIPAAARAKIDAAIAKAEGRT